MTFRLTILAALVFGAVAVAQATPITFDLDLTNINGNVAGGTGSLTIDSANAAPSGFYTTAGNSLTALSFLIDGQSFDLDSAPGGFAQAGFSPSGSLTSVTFIGVRNNNLLSLNVGALSYNYADINAQRNSQGTITASLATPPVSGSTAVPGPGSGGMLLLGSLILGFGVFARRRLS